MCLKFLSKRQNYRKIQDRPLLVSLDRRRDDQTLTAMLPSVNAPRHIDSPSVNKESDRIILAARGDPVATQDGIAKRRQEP
ncbi:hypothetical protein A3840_08900 [Devosia elaeis]|uniref:Uncharacterized protein n=1 Tax=Devosia elaeis TaxID=1770058 RepID=A0A178I092_9HYPH|nr:hypothetical protein A3840_08900 [Devosia elaeis]